MTAREWKPGDVAVVVNSDSVLTGKRALRCDDGKGRAGWAVANTDGLTMAVGRSELRPLVVIDPEDREQVERLANIYFGYDDNPSADDLQAALREFANPKPPKPEEPTGHLAVVEDAEGVRWTSWRDARDGVYHHERPWQSSAMGAEEWRDYADIDVVKIHWAGVPQ